MTVDPFKVPPKTPCFRYIFVALVICLININLSPDMSRQLLVMIRHTRTYYFRQMWGSQCGRRIFQMLCTKRSADGYRKQSCHLEASALHPPWGKIFPTLFLAPNLTL